MTALKKLDDRGLDASWTEFGIEAMTCASSVRRVWKALPSVPGVLEASVRPDCPIIEGFAEGRGNIDVAPARGSGTFGVAALRGGGAAGDQAA